jgi:hypothetical protein
MIQLLIGIGLLVASFAGLWFSRPVGGEMRSFAQGGRDVYIAIAVTVGVGLGLSSLVAGAVALAN